MKKFVVSMVAMIAISLQFSASGYAYYAEQGETLSEIAKWHEMSLKDLMDLNPHIKNPDHIHAGDYIIVRSPDLKRDLVDYARSLQEVTAYKVDGENFPYEVDGDAWVRGVYQKFGIELPETSREQAVTGEPVDFDHLEVGDLMFFSTRKDKEITHTGIYIDHNLWISNFDAENDVEIMNSWGEWAREYFLWGTRFKL